MSYKIKIPFYAVELTFHQQGRATVPMFEHQVVRLDATANALAKQFERAFQKKVIDKGNYRALIDHYQDGDYKKGIVVVNFKAARDGLAYPAFALSFEYLYRVDADGYWAFLPVLALESYAQTQEDLVQSLQETIRLEFTRKRRLRDLKSVIETQWFEQIKIVEQNVSLQYHTLDELDKVEEKQKEALLPQLANKLATKKQIVFGRERELAQLIQIIKGKYNRNILLVGASGVGKTSLVWELARLRTKNSIRSQVYETTASRLIKELSGDTSWQDGVSYLCQELSKSNDILFVRNLLELFEVGQYEGNSVSMADYLRSFLSKGEITLISECTNEEFAKIEARSPNYTTMFQVVRLQEPAPIERLEEIIIQRINTVASGHSIGIEPSAIRETVRLHKRYMPYSGFPGKPVRFLESLLLNKLKTNTKSINEGAIYEQFSEEAGMPAFMIDPSVPMIVDDVSDFFKSNLYGQDKAVASLVNTLATVKTGLNRQGKPIASFLFVGPTGVGKTEMAKVLAQFMFGSRSRMIRFDMSEFSSPYQVMRLTGLSYYQDGLLTSAIRQTPFSVLLFDEIEKADYTFYDLLLQILSEGRLTDSSGRLVNFCSCIIIMTSNIGASNLQTGRVGWNTELDVDDVAEHFISAVQKHFRPELYNRIDRVTPFQPITKEVIAHIVKREISLFERSEGIAQRELTLNISKEVQEQIGEMGYDPKYGARQIQRTIREKIAIPLAAHLNAFPYDEILEVDVYWSVSRQQIEFRVAADELKFDLTMEALTRSTYADLAESLRRSILQLQEGRFFVELTSKLEMLEEKLKKKGEAFWNSEDGAAYSHQLATKDRVEKMTQTILEYEEQFLLVAMGLKGYRLDIQDKVEAWEQDYFDLKVELYTRINPQSNTCRLGIYGQQSQRWARLYKNIIDDKSYTCTAKSLWFRESHFNEMIEEVNVHEDEFSGIITKTTTRKPRHEYIPQAFDFYDETASLVPPQSGDVMIGIELDIVGKCPYLYFEDEQGFHRWKQDGEKTVTYHVMCFEDVKTAKYPLDLHRKKHFERQNARRVYSNDHIKDNEYRINREIIRNNLLPMLINAMNEGFNAKLDQQLI